MTAVAAQGRPAALRPAGLSTRAGRGLAPWVYLAPAILTLVVWVYAPLVRAAWLSCHEWNLLPTSPKVWLGLTNYERLVELPEMRRALRNTGLYVAGVLPLSVGLPLVIAIFTAGLTGPLRNLYRACIFVPVIIAPVVAAAVWRWMLDKHTGIVNVVLKAWGERPVDFLYDRNVALWTIVWITGWKLMGFSKLILSAALTSINPSLIEAARIDGARDWQVTRDIRLPLLSPAILFLTMLTILLGAQWSFTCINVLTGGGPLNATTNICYLLWQFGFGSLAVGWASAAGMILFAGFGVIAALLLWLSNRLAVHDD